MRPFLPCLASLLFASSLLAATPAELAWQKGQQAMEADRIQEAISQFRLALRYDATYAQARLSLAAAYLALSDETQAAPQLDLYLRAKPEHFLIRMHYGELLHRMDRPEEAWGHVERVVREMQEHPRLADDHLVACHTRLMEIARDLGDDYAEHLHRGIGLYLLGKKRAEIGGQVAELSEELLCKAAAELTLARLRRPDEARPCWYLHGVWRQLAQRQPAVRWLRQAEEQGSFSEMTPSEKRELHLAASVWRMESARK